MDNEKDFSPVNEHVAEMSTMEKVEDWMTNTFWFHYKWYFIIGVFVLALLIMAAVGLASSVTYDWTVVYAHNGPVDAEGAAQIQEIMRDVLPETGKNRRVDVKVIELNREGGMMEEYGEHRMYSHLDDSNTLLYVLDEENYQRFATLGYFEASVSMSAMDGLYCAVNDAPVQKLDPTDPQYADFSQEFLDDVYLEYVEEHEGFLASAREVLAKVG